jgi:glycosyltransferase involved in cell wall biosynthesis
VAAAFCVANPTGWLRSPELEQTLDVLADVVPPAITSTSRGGVLHVVSEVHAVGGHRAMLLRWLEADRQLGVTAHLAVTRSQPVPSALVDGVLATGGSVTVLGRHRAMARASRLRALASHHDVVVCHTHADDPIPSIAFGSHWSTASGVPVAMVDHSDHLFWLGAGSFNALISLRNAGAQTAMDVRGVPGSRIHRLPIPISMPRLSRSSHEGVTLIAVARPQKFASARGGVTFPDVVTPALVSLPQTRLMVIGPEPSDPLWAGARKRLGDRLWLTGLQDDPGAWRQRSDIHLDPIPFGSATSLLESAAYGLPAIALKAATPRASLLTSAGVLDQGVMWAQTPAEYAADIVALVHDEARRQSLGEDARRGIQQTHGLSAWVERLRTFYSQVDTRTGSGAMTTVVRDPDYAAALMEVESGVPLQWIMSSAAADFDASDRALATARVTRARLIRRLHGHPLPTAGADADLLIPELQVSV